MPGRGWRVSTRRLPMVCPRQPERLDETEQCEGYDSEVLSCCGVACSWRAALSSGRSGASCSRPRHPTHVLACVWRCRMPATCSALTRTATPTQRCMLLPSMQTRLTVSDVAVCVATVAVGAVAAVAAVAVVSAAAGDAMVMLLVVLIGAAVLPPRAAVDRATVVSAITSPSARVAPTFTVMSPSVPPQTSMRRGIASAAASQRRRRWHLCRPLTTRP